jgi:16S rRNA (guanine527-N7)-methyltransferase
MFHVKHEAWAREAETVAGLALAPEQVDKLAAYQELLGRVAIPRGMIGAADADRLWERHILDGLRGARYVPVDASVADIGSGAGLPGIPLAVARSDASFTLIEPRTARAAFLEAATDDLMLSNVEVLPQRAETVAVRFDVCTARAFSSPEATWRAVQHVLEPGGSLIYWAGRSFDEALLAKAGVPFRLSTRSDLARSGPLVIMGPQ